MRLKARGFALALVGFLGVFALVVGAAGAVGEAAHSITDDVVDTPLEADAQHGGAGGHLPASSENVELVGKLKLSGVVPGRISDVATLGDFAYLGAFNTPCGEGGVYVVDISNPSSPTEVGFIPTAAGSFVSEGVQALSLKTSAFKGDILVINNEICGISGSQIGGFSIFDVTNPLSPVPLVEGAGDTDPGGAVSSANQIHSAFAWQQGKRAFVVIVDDEELEDVDIFEITNPSSPVFIAQVSLADWPGAQDAQSAGLGSFAASFLHDMVVKKVKGDWLMLLSYWDAGYIVLNVNDPANPVFVDDTTFTDPDPQTGISPPEGNAHQAEWSHNNRFILGADEDFSPTQIDSFTSSAFDGSRPASEASGTPLIANQPGGVMTGEVVHVGRGCPADPDTGLGVPDPYLNDPSGKIALIERGLCRFDNKIARAQQAGAIGVIVYNNVAGGEGLLTMGVDNPVAVGGPSVVGTTITIPAIFVQRSTGILLRDGTPPVTATATSEFNGWGYIHLFDAKTLAEIDTYAIPEALNPAFASGFGDLSVHEVATDPNNNLAYVSYYAGGFRVLEFGKKGIREVGRFIDDGGNNFWGVQVVDSSDGDDDDDDEGGGGPLVLASDRDFGLYLFRFTGDEDGND